LASAAAVRIDGSKIGEIAGTIAGDDTIFIAVDGAHDQKAAMKKLKMIFAAG
jgi:arginine repressor